MMTDTERKVAQLKLHMDIYKNPMLQINNLLLWEKPWYPSAIIGGCTAVFMLLWLSQPNTLTLISVLGLMITVCDYILPSIVSSVYKSEDWDNEKQQLYEEICTNIIIYRTKLELLFSSYYRMRVTNRKMYFSVTLLALVALAWLGNTVNNLFLAYILVLVILLLPGMRQNGMLNKSSETWSKIFLDLVENAKSKIAQKKTQ